MDGLPLWNHLGCVDRYPTWRRVDGVELVLALEGPIEGLLPTWLAIHPSTTSEARSFHHPDGRTLQEAQAAVDEMWPPPSWTAGGDNG